MFLLDWFYGVLASLGLWQEKPRILFLGPDNARMTMLLNMLKDEGLVQHQPTQCPTSEDLSIGKIKFTAFNFGGLGLQMTGRVLRDYNLKVDGVVCLVDACDMETFLELNNELHALLSDQGAYVPGLVLVDYGRVNLGMYWANAPFYDAVKFVVCSIIDKRGFKWLSQYIHALHLGQKVLWRWLQVTFNVLQMTLVCFPDGEWRTCSPCPH